MVRKTSANAPNVSAEQLASLSHEFRTPLNGVLGMARLLEGTRLTAEQKAYVAALRESGEHLLGLVNDVLDFAKLGSDRIDLHPSTFEVEGMLRSVCELLSPRAREKGVEIAWAAPAGIGQALADEGRLKQILLNFAGNAIKFTKVGGVLVTAAERGGALRFTVEDTGPGVTEAAREKIFEAFEQADPIHDMQLGGAGLGLAIARKLAVAMDGQVGVDTAPGGGAAFWFEATFPRLAVKPEQQLAGLRIGIAAANPMVREAARRQVEAGGAQVIAAGDIETVSKAKPDVLLLDHALGSHGRMVRRPAGRTAIVLLAPEDRGKIAGYRAAGYSGYLIKPLRRGSVVERILAAAEGAGTPRLEAPDDDRIAGAAAPGARVLLVEDNPINALLARTLLAREGCTVDQASGGEEALAAVSVGQYDLILMDMRMPGLSGPETTVQLRAKGVRTPVVALTANAFEDDRQTCLAAGMDDFLVKPLAPDALREALARWGGRRSGWTADAERAKVG